MRKLSQLLCLSALVPLGTLFACAEQMAGDEADSFGHVEQNLDTASSFLACSDTTCVTRLRPLPDNIDDSLTWDPCAGQAFTWTADIDFEPTYDSITIDGTLYDGWATSISGSAEGPVDLLLHTDVSVHSGGFRNLTAVCPAAPPAPAAPVYLETECSNASTGAYMQARTTKADFSGTGYVQSVANTLTTNGTHDTATFYFESGSGGHSLYFRINTNANQYDDSWFYRINGGSWVTMNGFSSLGNGWVWAKATASANLSSGAHTLEVMSRENGFLLDKIAVVPAGSAAPSGVGEAGHNCPIPPADVSCGDLTCGGGDLCCSREGLGTSYCTQTCQSDSNGGAVTIHACDSHDDCGSGNLCVHAMDGNGGSGGFVCMTSEAAADPFHYRAELCASPVGSWPEICPSGEVCGMPDSLGYAACQLPPDVSCGELTCSGGEVCCGGYSDPEFADSPSCGDSAQTCFSLGMGAPSTCDQQEDCGAEVCAIVGAGNQGVITKCYPEDELAQYEAQGSFAHRLCASPAGSSPCPSGQVCGEPNQFGSNLIGYSYCQTAE